MSRRGARGAALGWVLLIVGLVGATGAGAQPQVAGRAVALQGQVHVERTGVVQAARIRQELFAGDVVRTGPASRAAILLADESRVKLNANATLHLKAVAPRPPRGVIPVALRAGKTLLEMVVGEIWVQTTAPPDGLEIETPAVVATIRGTEFDLIVAPDGESRLALLEGVVDYRNPFGAVLLRSGELGIARVGQPPQKQILLNPEDAVQWSLYYPGIVSFRDYPLVTADPTRLEALLVQARAEAAAAPADLERRARVGEILHDLGRRGEARAAFSSILAAEPSRTRALVGLGWVALEAGRLDEAIATFAAATPPTPSGLLGRSLARFRRGELATAAADLDAALQQFGPSPAILIQRALLDLLAGEVDPARRAIDEALRLDPGFALAHGLRSNIALTQNRKDEALAAARRAVEANPYSPSAHLDLSLALQAHFQLEAALEAARRAVTLDPENARAHVQIARLLFGFDRIEDASQAAQRARALEPAEPLILATLGFIRLARGETGEAVAEFERALDAGSTLGDPYLGLGLAAFRQGRPQEGLGFFQAAVLMEPRVSTFQSYLGKALYQVERREEGLQALERARVLDPRDPTPALYTGIFLTDLNRPAEALEALQRSVVLNDNRAIYRSRLLLDRDLAARNVNLTRPYLALGQQERALAAGIRAIHEDPQSSSAHLFYGTALVRSFGEGVAGNSELLQTRILLPVNQNTFNTFNDYTMLLEQPRLQGNVEGTVGSFENRAGSLLVFGGTNRVAGRQFVDYFRTDGPRPKNSDDLAYTSITLLKAAPALRSSAFLSILHFGEEFGDTSADRRAFTPNDENVRTDLQTTRFELGYQVQAQPESNLLLLAQGGQFLHVRTRDPVADVEFVSRKPFYDLQAAYLHRLGAHQFWLGAEYFGAEPEAEITAAAGSLSGALRQQAVTLVTQDTWQVRRGLYLTGALRYDYARDSLSTLNELAMTSSVLSPQAGLLWQLGPAHTLRLAAFRSFQSHFAPRLFPTQLAGFFVEGTQVTSTDSRQYHLAWDADLSPTTFFTVGAFRRDVDVPTPVSRPDGTVARETVTQHRTGGEIALNQILGPYWGLAAKYIHLYREEPDTDGQDGRLELRAHFVHPSGLSARGSLAYVQQDLGAARPPGAPRDFWVANLAASYEFPGKTAVLTIGAENLFGQRFDVRSDAVGRDVIRVTELPDLRVFATLRVNF